jgi:hypothetical protein
MMMGQEMMNMREQNLGDMTAEQMSERMEAMNMRMNMMQMMMEQMVGHQDQAD